MPWAQWGAAQGGEGLRAFLQAAALTRPSALGPPQIEDRKLKGKLRYTEGWVCPLAGAGAGGEVAEAAQPAVPLQF